jgi:4-amino-4-deoxy-L-arabinose transferase-like glycosyltransferase
MRRAALGLLLAVAALAWFGTLGVRPLYKAAESRYGEVSREMVASGDWLTPRLNGYKYFEKPPLQYWATAVFFKTLGPSDLVARLWNALTAFCGVLLAIAAGKRLFGRPAGYFAGAVLAGSPLYLALGQINTLDMGLTFFLSAAVFAFAIAQGERRRHWMLVFWAACAAAVLSKGLIGIVLPLGAITLYVLVRRDWALLSRLELLRGGALFLAIAAPWFVAVSLANDEFLRFFFVQEHFQRFTTHIHGREHPAWFFIPVLALGMAPWLPALVAAWASAARSETDTQFRPALFLALWAATVFVFFSLSGSKLPGYILPILPALAVLIGRWIVLARPARLLAAQALLCAAAGFALAAGAASIPGRLSADLAELAARYIPWLVVAGGSLAAASLASLAAGWRRRLGLASGLLTAGVLAATQIAIVGHGTLAPAYSIAATVGSLPVPPAAQAPVFAVDSYDHTMPWVLRRTVTMVRYKDELAQAVSWQPGDFIADLPGFARAWQAAPQAYAFFAARDFERLRAELALPMEVLARGPRHVLVRKP